MPQPSKTRFTFLDLFCGCGGFSLGMQRAGFRCLGAIDFNPEAVQVFQANFSDVPHVFNKDLTKFTPEEFEALIGTKTVDVIIGGPPCQGFSQARQRDGANHGKRIVEDARRHLYKRFLSFVNHFQPKIFVMENVLGIKSAAGGEYFTRVQAEARELGYRVVPREEDATKLAVPQNRRRQLFIGIREDIPGYLSGQLKPVQRAKHLVGVTLGDAIMDLPPLEAGCGSQESKYDIELRKSHVDGSRRHYLFRVLEVRKATVLTAHEARPHSARDLGDFRKLREGENCKQAARNRGVVFDFPYDKSSFEDRYTRQSRSRPCSTIVAHMSKDGLMFIHPTQLRSLTPREAARVQTFPDWFVFPVCRTHQYRVIGNAVPPLVGEAVGNAVTQFLENAASLASNNSRKVVSFRTSETEALDRLAMVATLSRSGMRSVDRTTFLRAWHSLLFLYPELQPDNATDHGEAVYTPDSRAIGALDLTQRYIRTNWPVNLNEFGKEGWRRFVAGEFSEAEFYCVAAHLEGRKAFKLGQHTSAPSQSEQAIA